MQNSKGYVGVVYRSPSQNILNLKFFLSKFEKVLSVTTFCNPLFTIILGDWWTTDKTTIERTQLESLTNVYGFHQLIPQPTHLLPQTFSCIDLIFTDQPHLIVDSGVHPSLHSNCHHQITCCKINLNIEYQPPYEHLVWECIKKSIESVNWEVMFNNKQFHKQISIFNEVLRNIFSNCTPNKLVTFDDRDPPWLNDFVKSKIKWKNQLHKIYTKNGYKYNDYVQLKEATVLVSQVIAKRKEDCHNVLASKLNNPKTSAKAYWSILKSFYNGKKIPVIPPLLINNEIISDFKMKANHFNSFFASHCTPLNNNSKVPESQTYITDSKLSSLQFEDKDIIKIIRSLDINISHGHDDKSIRMLKICDLAIIKPLSMIFRNCINNSTFPDLSKKSNICPIHKKVDKQIINNYRPVSLLPICGKIFERLIFNSLFEYLEK